MNLILLQVIANDNHLTSYTYYSPLSQTRLFRPTVVKYPSSNFFPFFLFLVEVDFTPYRIIKRGNRYTKLKTNLKKNKSTSHKAIKSFHLLLYSFCSTKFYHFHHDAESLILQIVYSLLFIISHIVKYRFIVVPLKFYAISNGVADGVCLLYILCKVFEVKV